MQSIVPLLNCMAVAAWTTFRQRKIVSACNFTEMIATKTTEVADHDHIVYLRGLNSTQ